MTKIILASAAALAAFAGVANAQVVAAWDLFGQPGDQATSAATQTAANINGTALTRGAGLVGNPGNNSFNSAGWDGLDANDYIAFGFTVDAGYLVNLDSLYIGSRSSNSGPGQLGLFSSVDGFATSLYTINQSGTNFTNSVIDLSALDGLTGSVEFRIRALSDVRADGSTGISAAGTFRVSDYFDGDFSATRFTGEVLPVPAPGAAALGIIGFAMAARRRRA